MPATHSEYSQQGAQSIIVTKANETFSGIFAGSQKSNDDYNFLFKMVRKTTTTDTLSQGEYVGNEAEHTMVFPTNSLLSIDTPEEQIAPRGTSANGITIPWYSHSGLTRVRSFNRIPY